MKSEGFHVVAFQRVASARVCQEKYCQQDEECQYFDYSENGGLCTLKTEQASTNTSPSKGNIFGPKYCPGKLIFLSFTLDKINDRTL